MNDDSDTESEPDVLPSTPVHFPQQNEFKAAVDRIQDTRMDQIHATSIPSSILQDSALIIQFLDDLHLQDPSQFLPHFSLLIRPSFLKSLLEQRTVYHQIISDASGEPSSIICWVDQFLSKLADATAAVASGLSEDTTLRSFPSGIRLQRDDDNLRAASQLPDSWPAIFTIFASKKVSPAARRIALRLAFAVFLVAPVFFEVNPWEDFGIDPHTMKEVLLHCITQTLVNHSLVTFSSDYFAQQDRVNFAILLVLLSATEDSLNRDARSPLIPHTQTCCLNLVQVIMHPDSSITSLSLGTPLKSLDGAQKIFLAWGSTIRWCWQTWDDPRTANSETIVYTTVNWLYHIGSSKPREIANALIRSDLHASSGAILAVLHHTCLQLYKVAELQSLSSQLTLFEVLDNACWLASLLFRSGDLFATGIESNAPEICRRLCQIFVLLAENNAELSLLDSILESLSLIQCDVLHSALERLENDPSWITVIDRVIHQCQRLVANAASNVGLSLLRQTLQFLVIVYHSGDGRAALPPSISQLLSSATELVSLNAQSQMFESILGAIMLVSVFGNVPLRLQTGVESEPIYALAIGYGTSYLSIASCFSRYILSTDGLPDDVCCAEAWDYLRDCLVLTIQRHYVDEDEPLAILVSPVLCHALIRLTKTRSSLRLWIQSSPWTMTLCTELKNLLQSRDQQPLYHQHLKSRLATVGLLLLEQLGSGSGDQVKVGRLTAIRRYSYAFPATTDGS